MRISRTVDKARNSALRAAQNISVVAVPAPHGYLAVIRQDGRQLLVRGRAEWATEDDAMREARKTLIRHLSVKIGARRLHLIPLVAGILSLILALTGIGGWFTALTLMLAGLIIWATSAACTDELARSVIDEMWPEFPNQEARL